MKVLSTPFDGVFLIEPKTFIDGREKQRIVQLINKKGLSNKFHFLGSFPPEQMPEYFACADALLITLKKAEIFSYTIPGKLQSYLACGKPIVGALGGIGKRIIEESKSGFCTDAENATELAKLFLNLSRLPKDEIDNFSENARSYFNDNFAKDKLLLDLEKIFNT